MVAIRSLIEEGIEEVQDMAVISIVLLLVLLILSEGLYPLRIERILSHFLKNFNLWLSDEYLIIGSLEIVLRTLHDFDGNVGGVLEIFGQPDSREVSPAQFLNEYIPIVENFPNMARMIAALEWIYPSMT
jgi:hypothetical protein